MLIDKCIHSGGRALQIYYWIFNDFIVACGKGERGLNKVYIFLINN